MAREMYQFGTSPRKLEPDYSTYKKEKKSKETKKQKLSKEEIRKKQLVLKKEKRKHHKNIALIISVFLVLLAISYRDSLITERFNEIQEKKQELASIQKTSEQLKVSIEGSLNLNNVEKSAQEKLGMQKLSNDQKVYVSLDKKDYTESSKNKIIKEDNTNWFMNIINNLFE